jgi:hypothetical protein
MELYRSQMLQCLGINVWPNTGAAIVGGERKKESTTTSSLSQDNGYEGVEYSASSALVPQQR